MVVLALDGVYPFELGIPLRVFGTAGDLYQVTTCTVDGRPVRTLGDFTISVGHGPEALRTADTVVIPPYGPLPETPGLPAAVADALAAIRPGARTVSICTGAFVLAAAGMLDGRPATTHWREAARFRELFPRVRLDADVLFVEAPTSEEAITRVATELGDVSPLVFNWAEGGRTPPLSFERIAELGFSLVLYPIATLLAATAAVQGVLGTIARERTPLSVMDTLPTFGEFTDLIGLPEVQELEQRFRG